VSHDRPPAIWADEVDAHDYAAAKSYLTLRWDRGRAAKAVESLRGSEITTRRVNDILRAYDRQPLPLDDPGVRNTLIDLLKGKLMSPVLLVGTEDGGDIVDGYHRVSLQYHLDPFGDVPVKLAISPK
jgi:hypothetical protein